MLRGTLVGIAALGLAAATVVPAVASGQELRWKFDSASAVVSTVVDDSGKGHTGTAATANGGQITTLTPGRDGIGQAVQFPALCAGTGCPKAIITSPDETHLNPGTTVFSYGTWVNVTTAELSPTLGANVMQKGLYNTAQWKLQIDQHNGTPVGAPSCVVRQALGANSVIVYSDITVADGNWHKVVCQRTTTDLEIYVDNNFRASKPLVVSPYTIDPSGQPLTVGAKSVGNDNDQYHGRLDDLFYNAYLAY